MIYMNMINDIIKMAADTEIFYAIHDHGRDMMGPWFKAGKL